MSDQDKKELKFILQSGLEATIALTIAFTVTFLIAAIWKI